MSAPEDGGWQKRVWPRDPALEPASVFVKASSTTAIEPAENTDSGITHWTKAGTESQYFNKIPEESMLADDRN